MGRISMIRSGFNTARMVAIRLGVTRQRVYQWASPKHRNGEPKKRGDPRLPLRPIGGNLQIAEGDLVRFCETWGLELKKTREQALQEVTQ